MMRSYEAGTPTSWDDESGWVFVMHPPSLSQSHLFDGSPSDDEIPDTESASDVQQRDDDNSDFDNTENSSSSDNSWIFVENITELDEQSYSSQIIDSNLTNSNIAETNFNLYDIVITISTILMLISFVNYFVSWIM